MEFNGYEFDESFRPEGYHEYAKQSILPKVDFAFYLTGDKVFNDYDGSSGNKNEIYCFCPSEEKYFDFELKPKEKMSGKSCPNEPYCEKVCTFKNVATQTATVSRSKDFAFWQRTEQGVVLRVFSYLLEFKGERYELNRYAEHSENEYMRVFFNKDRKTEIYSKLMKCYSGFCGYFLSVGSNWQKKKWLQCYANFEIFNYTKGTLLEGYSKYVDFASNYIGNSPQEIAAYIAMFNTPALKEIIKQGYDNIADEYIGCFASEQRYTPSNFVRGKKRTIKDFFKFEPSKLDKVRDKESLNLEDLPILRKLVEIDLQINYVTIEMCRHYRFKNLVEKYDGKDLKTVLKYLLKQDIETSDLIGDYLDYIKECEQLKLDLTDKQVLFPKSLQRAHTRTMQAVQYENTKELRKKFEKQAKKYEKYSFRQRNISLRALRTYDELVNWSKKFSNCSLGYADRIAEGRAMIFIIVDRNKAKAPYYMLEYNPKSKEIVQCRKKSNRGSYKEDTTIKEFCDNWLNFVAEKSKRKTAKAA